MVTLDEFKKSIREHRSVMLRYHKLLPQNDYPELRYDMDENGFVCEVYTYNRTAYSQGHIDSEKLAERMKLNLEGAFEIFPTPEKDVRKFNMLYNL